MDHREAIEKRIGEFLLETDPRFDWLKPAVREYRFLPLYLGWVAVLGVRPDGSFVRWSNEEEPIGARVLSDSFYQRLALCQGAKKYPELAAMLPQRPDGAEDCASCKGTGHGVGLPVDMICFCGGVGWVIPGEAKGPSPG